MHFTLHLIDSDTVWRIYCFDGTQIRGCSSKKGQPTPLRKSNAPV